MKKMFLLCFTLCCFLISCDDDGSQTNFSDIDVLTGLTLVDDNGQSLGLWNIPNENPGNLTIFPNPINNNAFLTDSQEGIKRVWIIPADCAADDSPNIATESLNLSFSISELEAKQIQDITLQTSSISLSINFTDIPTGFYKVFAEMDSGAIYWYNVYRYDSNSNGADAISNLDNLCN